MNNFKMFIVKYGCKLAYYENNNPTDLNIELFGSIVRFTPFFYFPGNFFSVCNMH